MVLFVRTGVALRAFVLSGCVVLGCACSPSQQSSGASPAVATTPAGAVEAWVSTTDGSRRLARESDLTLSLASGAADIEIDPGQRYQAMLGFGAALTDSSAWLIQNKLDAPRRAALLEDLFSAERGIGLSFMRLTVGSSDFSRSHYSYDDMPRGQTDAALERFSIEPARAEVLPVMRAALAVNPSLRVMISPWSAPGWMKTNDSLIRGSLREDAYGPFADYLVRTVDAYTAEGVPVFALSVQNEPLFEPPDYAGMRVDAAARARFIGAFLGPRLAQRHPQTRLIEWDHNWDRPDEPLAVLSDPTARRYISGVGWHCYAGELAAQSQVHDAYPDKDAYFTECSGGEWEPLKSDGLTWLVRTLIIGSTRHWARGVLFWNVALDERFGPRTGGCKDCRGVVTIDSTTGAVTRNFEYYALAHASRFVRRGAERIASSPGRAGLDNVAFRHPDDGSLVLIVSNSATEERRFTVRVAGVGFAHTLPGRSVATFVWR